VAEREGDCLQTHERSPLMPNKQMRQKLTKLIHTETVLDFAGIRHVSVLLEGKEYTYAIPSEFAYRQFLKKMKLKQKGRALNILNKFKIEAFHGKTEAIHSKPDLCTNGDNNTPHPLQSLKETEKCQSLLLE
jgi:hypothetical protein